MEVDMPTPRKLPSNATILRLHNQGWTYKQIADQYGVSEAAAHKAASLDRSYRKRRTLTDLLPWDVAPQHKAVAIAERFRSMLKEERGEPLDARDARLLNQWRSDMDEAGLVVDYHREAPANSASRKGGFFYTPRVDGETGYIRYPSDS